MRLDTTDADSARARIVRDLHELIAALDRRVPQVERVGEVAIARAGAALRLEALKRIGTLERATDADAIASWSGPTQATAYTRQTLGGSNGPERDSGEGGNRCRANYEPRSRSTDNSIGRQLVAGCVGSSTA